MNSMKKWLTLETKNILKAHVFRYVKVKRQSPETLDVGEFDIVQCSNWVNIVAITPEKKIVIIKQYRHGIDSFTTEIPGGAINYLEESLVAAKRELVEETGFTSDKWYHLGKVDVNPAFMTNFCEINLALDAIKTQVQNLDPFEEITVSLEDLTVVEEMIKNEEITHSLVILAIHYYFRFLMQQP